MRTLLVRGALVAGLLLALTTAAQAQIGWQVGLGISHPTTDGADNGFHGMGAATFGVPAAPFKIRADALYHSFDGASIIGLNGDAVYSFAPGPISPYVLGGASWARAKPDGVDAQSDFGFNLGGGINFGLGPMKAFAEARYLKVGDGDAMIPITVGLHF